MARHASPSNTAVDKAGAVLRQWARRGGPKLEGEAGDAADVLIDFRATFLRPMEVVADRLGQILRERGAPDPPGNRPKRYGSIVIKLLLRPTMRLSQMEDIAGCRAVLRDQDEVYDVLGRIQRQWPDSHVDDYVARPQATGYRAVHVVVVESGRKVEIQLRTPAQNRWADEVEAAGDRLGHLLKNGQGPPELLRYFERAAYKLALEERGETPDEAFERDFATLREQVRPYFRS